MLAKSNQGDEHIVTLLGIEIFTPPKVVQLPIAAALAVPVTVLQSQTLEALKAKHKPTLMQRLMNGHAKSKPVNLPG